MSTRRDVLITVAGASLLKVLPQSAAQVPPVNLFSSSEKSLVTLLTDIIIPATDTPGASAAGVPAFIERELSIRADLAPVFRRGLQIIDREAKRRFGGAFREIKSDQQTALLTSYQSKPTTEGGRFFRLLKDLTVDGYYTSEAGLEQELKWNGYRFMTEFPGCTHPEHKD